MNEAQDQNLNPKSDALRVPEPVPVDIQKENLLNETQMPMDRGQRGDSGHTLGERD